MTITIRQAPTELLDYIIDWATRGLNGATIASQDYSQSDVDFTLSQKSIVASPSTAAASSATKFFLTGGIPGNFYTFTNTIQDSAGRTLTETITYECVNAEAA